jgi:hypothetical protein
MGDMDWYWWVLIAVVAFFVLRAVVRGSKRKAGQAPASDEFAFLHEARERRAVVDRELAKVVALIANLPVVLPNPAFGNTLARDALPGSVSNFMQSAGLTGASTQTKMLHVVTSPVQVAAFVKLRPTEPQTAVREFVRIGEDKWAFRTRQADDMERAIRAAEQAAAQVDAELKASRSASSAAKPVAPAADGAAAVNADLTAPPLPRTRMNLLWVGPAQLAMFKAMARGGYTGVAIAGADGAASVEPSKTIMRQISEGRITEQDIEWAINVDAIAGEAEALFGQGDLLEAIAKYREALRYAPGCDVYLMSVGTCYGELGALKEAIRYFERAAQISPDNARIARNLTQARNALAQK